LLALSGPHQFTAIAYLYTQGNLTRCGIFRVDKLISANQKNVAVVFEQMKEELENHHTKHYLGSRHNRRHPTVEKIIDIVKLN